MWTQQVSAVTDGLEEAKQSNHEELLFAWASCPGIIYSNTQYNDRFSLEYWNIFPCITNSFCVSFEYFRHCKWEEGTTWTFRSHGALCPCRLIPLISLWVNGTVCFCLNLGGISWSCIYFYRCGVFVPGWLSCRVSPFTDGSILKHSGTESLYQFSATPCICFSSKQRTCKANYSYPRLRVKPGTLSRERK